MTEVICKEIAEERGMLESETYRKSCEIRTVLDMPQSSRAGYMDRVEAMRGAKAANELRESVRKEWMRRKAG